MKCKLCGKETAGFLSLYHPECLEALKREWSHVTAVLDAYEGGILDATSAKKYLLTATSGKFLQKHFSYCVLPGSSIASNSQIVYGYNLIECSEEKNRCHMVRTGLSYAKYPVWSSVPVSLSDVTSIALTDNGVWLLGFEDLFIPYKKITAVDTELVLFSLTVCFNVKTTSPVPHRFRIWPTVKNDSRFAVDSCRIIRLMIGAT